MASALCYRCDARQLARAVEDGESERTPLRLAATGIRAICDWTTEEQLYRMNTSRREQFA